MIITDDQASLLVGAGLAFADAGDLGATPDEITMTANAAEGTHLRTSLQDLQKLGVDTVLVTGTDSVTVDLGGAGDGVLDGGLGAVNIPLFGDTNTNGTLTQVERDALTVTLNLNGVTADAQIEQVVDVAQQLHDAGIDYIGINGRGAGAVHITDDQASLLVDAGLSFSTGIDGLADQIEVQVTAEGTHLKTSLQDLQRLGVTNLTIDGLPGTQDLGSRGMNIIDGEQLEAYISDNFDVLSNIEEDEALTVTLDLGLGMEALLPDNDPIYDFLAARGIDRIAITESLNANASDARASDWINLSELDAIQEGTETSDPESKGIGFEVIASGSSGDDAAISLDQNLTGIDLLSEFTTPSQYGDLIQTLTDTGVMNILVDQGNVKIGDALAKALVDSGMLNALPNANVSLVYQPIATLDNPNNYAYLNASLKDMAMLGVDKVDYSATNKNKVYVDFGLPTNDTAALNDVKAILATLEPQDPASKVFSDGVGAKATALVVNQHFYDNLLKDLNVDQDVVDGLLKLGISEVDVLIDSNLFGVEHTTLSGTIVGSTVTVNLIGTDTGNAEYDYLHLKHPV